MEKSLNFKNKFPGPGQVLEFCRCLKSSEIVTSPIYLCYSHGAKSSVVSENVAFVRTEHGQKRHKKGDFEMKKTHKKKNNIKRQQHKRQK